MVSYPGLPSQRHQCKTSRSELRKQLCAITGASENEAARVLELHQYDLLRATDAYLKDKAASEDAGLVAIFNKYKESDQCISVDGTLAYLGDLGLEPEDLRSLTVAYLLGSLRMGEFERPKFMSYWKGALECPALVGAMRRVVDARHQQIFLDSREFERLYVYCFDFIRSSDLRIKSIPPSEATDYWRLLFGERSSLANWPAADALPRLDQWYEFVRTENKSVSKDLWVMFLKFVGEVILADAAHFGGYDEMSSWPSVIDEYVEWLRERHLLELEKTT